MKNIFLLHFSEFQPLWQQEGLIQIGPRIKNGPYSINISTVTTSCIRRSLRCRGIPDNGVLIHYSDPFLIRTFPLRGIRHWQGPKILACGDLHHGPNPILTLKNYLLLEPHDSVLLTFNPALLNEVQNSIKQPVRSIPPTFFRYPTAVPVPNPIQKLLHVGSLGPHHSHRKKLVSKLIQNSIIPFEHATTKNPNDAASLYAQYALILNIPLNNDLNHRIFEIMSAGVPQIIYGSKKLLGDYKHLENRPDIFWVSSIQEVEILTTTLFQNMRQLRQINVKPPPYLSLKTLLKEAFKYQR